LAITSEQVKIARDTVAKGLDDNQFAVYLYNCQRQGVHPLDGLIVPVLRTDDGQKKLTFVTTVDLLRSRAAETDDYAGSDDPVFEYDTENKPIAATVTIWKFVHEEKCSFTATARYDEYYPGEKQGFMWRSKPHIMLGKCAEGLAIRKAFPKQLAGLYLEEELAKENKPRASKQAPAPVGNVKCNQCHAIGGHLPSCPTKKQPAPEQQSPKEDIMCGDCGVVNGHKADCKYAKKADPDMNLTETVVVINAISAMNTKPNAKKETKPYLVLEVTDRQNLDWKMYVWHQSLFQYLKPKQMMTGQFSTRTQGDKTFCSLEKVTELAGVTFVDNKPAQQQGTLVPEQEHWDVG
jgi:phage recombination protein Bet